VVRKVSLLLRFPQQNVLRPEMHEVSGDDISDNSVTEGDSGQAHWNIDNDMVDDLPTTSANSENDTSKLLTSV